MTHQTPTDGFPAATAGRLVVLSNRVPTQSEPAGGLVVALHDCLTERGGLWIGSSGAETIGADNTLTAHKHANYTRMTFDLTPDEHDKFYLGYANSILWPLFHHRSDLMQVDPAYIAAYTAVNARVAKMVAAQLEPEDVLWVHDYHFLPIARDLRKLGVNNRIGFFLHTPFPVAPDVLALPERAAFNTWLAAFDLVGLQTERDVAALLELFRSDPKAEFMSDGSIKTATGQFRVKSFPIGIDVDDFVNLADAAGDGDALALAPDTKLIIGVDRLDYSKGLVNRFEAFATYLRDHAASRPRATLVQIAQPSREALDAYQDMRTELEATSGAINGTYGELDWTPIRYMNRGVPRARLAGVYRRADVCLVTPIADGMNLVAKEFIAAQDAADPGVLILSHFAGAAEQMVDALLVNPYDTEEVATAIARALDMTIEERRTRHARLLQGLRAQNITWWANSFLTSLDAPRVRVTL